MAGYPLPMVHAEKIVTALQRGVANTRWRDFADVYLLSRRHDVDGAEMRDAIRTVVESRQATLVPLADGLSGFAALGQARWAAWVHRQQLGDQLPATFEQVLDAVIDFADPVLAGTVDPGVWRAEVRTWQLS